jgi:universal stress protein A
MKTATKSRNKTNRIKRSPRATAVVKRGEPAMAQAGLARRSPLLRPKRILVPIDFSKESLKALRYAVPFAEQFGASLCLICVLDRASALYGGESIALAMPERALIDEARRRLLTLAADEIEEVVPVDAQVRTGKPWEEIVTVAKELDIDLIIIATHGYGGLKHVLMGSTAERVVRHAPCPVLVVREAEKEFVQT